MSFGQAIAAFFVNYVNFSGRASRSEYWFAVLFVVLASIACGAVDRAIGHTVLQGIFGLAMFLPNLSVQVRRLHDTDRTGWWLLGAYLPGFVTACIGVAMMVSSQGSGNIAATSHNHFMGFIVLVAGILASMAGYLLLLVWMCLRGTFGANDYGHDPLDQDPRGHAFVTRRA